MLGLVELLLVAKAAPHIVIGLGIVLPEYKRLLVMLQRLVLAPEGAERIAQIVVRLGIAVAVDRRW